MKPVTAEELIKSLKSSLGDKFIEGNVKNSNPYGKKSTPLKNAWIKIEKEGIRDVVKYLMTLNKYPHMSVVSNDDLGEAIELNYHFSVNCGIKHKEFILTVKVHIPVSDLVIDTISDLIPGAELTEREKIEMLGITFTGIINSGRAFLPRDYPEGMLPLRKDEENVKKLEPMVRELFVEDRQHLPWKKEAKK